MTTDPVCPKCGHSWYFHVTNCALDGCDCQETSDEHYRQADQLDALRYMTQGILGRKSAE